MRISKIIISFIFLILIGLFNNIDAAINMTISPIKYEINAEVGEVITREGKLTNHTDQTIHIVTGKSDFISNENDGTPKFIRKSEVVFEQELSDWITIDTPSFDIAPEETITINFTINIPENATPGGHYGAVFFKNNNSEVSSGANVGINVDYGILILLKVEGEINSEIEIGEPRISNSGTVKHMDVCNETGGDKSGNYYDSKCELNGPIITNTGTTTDNNTENKEIGNNIFIKDKCFIDLTSSDYDGKCVNNIDEIVNEITGNIKKEDINTDSNINNTDNDFNIGIEVPIENSGNTHVNPKGKITLIDENGNELKGIGKEVVINDKGAIIGVKIVDYIPFNDVGGNILPGTKRVYKSEWKGFPYKAFDEEGNEVVNYWTPTEYYTNLNFNKIKFVMPWQRISTKINHEKIIGKFEISYPNENGENIEYNSAKEFYVDYKEEYIGLNPYFFMLLGLLLSLIFFIFLIFRKKKTKCINKNCTKKIDKDLKICPYCGTEQKHNTNSEKTNNKKRLNKNKKEDTKPIIVALKKQKLKTIELELKDNIKNILIENKLKYAENITNLTKQEVLEIKGIGEVALKEIIKALKKEKLKLQK